MPEVCVITPCYNSARYVAQTMASVRAQTAIDWEHILVDDGSTDDTAVVIENDLALDSRVRLVRQPNRGAAAARNAGYRAASRECRYVLFLDADDWLERAMLEHMVTYLDEHPDAGVAYCDPILVNADGERISASWPARLVSSGAGVQRLPEEEPVTPFESVYLLAGIIPSLALIRREVYDRTPGWDETFGQPCEDTDLFLFLSLESDIHFIPARLANHRVHSGQSVNDVDRLTLQQVRLYEKWQGMAKALGAAGPRVVAAHRLLRVAQLSNRLGDARKYLMEGRPLVAARFALGAARRFILPPLGTVEAVGRRRAPAHSGW